MVEQVDHLVGFASSGDLIPAVEDHGVGGKHAPVLVESNQLDPSDDWRREHCLDVFGVAEEGHKIPSKEQSDQRSGQPIPPMGDRRGGGDVGVVSF